MLADAPRGAEPAYREAFARAQRLGRPVLASWTRPIPQSDAIGFFAQADASDERALWLRPSSGEALVGVGAAHVLTGRGATRFSEIDAAWRDLLADAVIDDTGEAGAAGGPRLLGGFSFDPSQAPSGLWAGFSDGRMVLPERLLVVRDGATWLTTNVLAGPDGDDGRSAPTGQPTLLGRSTTAQAAAAAQADEAEADADAEEAAPGMAPEQWQRLVGDTAGAIRRGELGLEKVVLARARRVHLPAPINARALLRTLAEAYPSCTVFAIGHAQAMFVGATPERLIALSNGLATSMALAGSVSRGATLAEDEALALQLLADPKEQAEHAVVVSALRDGLTRAGLCTRIIADAQPRVQKLPNLQHLLTHVHGQVAPGTSVLDLVARLHPTPAVGGSPSAVALDFMRAHEKLDRGWYAGPLGWLDASGNGEFVVGIRSALLRGRSATLFAGCGIVAESQVAAEYAESNWKLRPLLGALGVAE
ncbi:MAG TPA: isochorismate synthase [Chloroflexota bacterium]|nr:isochorismate synthase [Chloroflexota bacterium]